MSAWTERIRAGSVERGRNVSRKTAGEMDSERREAASLSLYLSFAKCFPPQAEMEGIFVSFCTLIAHVYIGRL